MSEIRNDPPLDEADPADDVEGHRRAKPGLDTSDDDVEGNMRAKP